MSRELDGAINRGTRVHGLEHFHVANRFHADPYDVWTNWPAYMVEDALAILAAEGRQGKQLA